MCKAWSLTLREEHGLSWFGNRVLNKISGSRRETVTGDWRQLCNDLYCSDSYCEDQMRKD